MNNKKSFVLDSKSLKIKEVLNQDFMEIEILAISEGLNRNKSFFTLESMEKAIPTFYNKFIMGYYRVNNLKSGEGVFEEHNSDIRYDKELDEFYWSYTAANAEKPLGLVRESDKVEIIEQDGKQWIRLTAVILTKYNREAVKHLLKSKGKRKVSVEVTVTKSHEKDGIEIIEEFILDAITILGNRKNSTTLCEEGIEGASLKILNFEQVLQKQKEAVCFAYKELDNNFSDNEKEDKIEMEIKLENDETLINNEKEMEGLTLTYEQKRDILESVLREQKCTEECDYVWVADLSEEEVFFCFNGDYYKTTYTLSEDGHECTINVENAVKVVRDWKEFSAEGSEEVIETQEIQEQFTEENSEEEKKEVQSEEETEEETEEEKKVEASEEEFVEDAEDKDEKDEQEQNCGNYSEEEKKEVQSEEETEEETEEEKKVEASEEKDEGCEKCGKEKCECSSEEDKETCPECGKNPCECSSDESGEKKEESKEEDEDDKDSDPQEEKEEEDYKEKYEILFKEYEELKDSYSLLETQKLDLDNKIEQIENTQKNVEMLTYGYEIIASEASLDEEDIVTLKASFKEVCENEKFIEKEQVDNYLEINIPKFFYNKHKEEKINKSKEEDFSMQFSNPTNTKVEQSSIDKMRNLLKIK